MRDLDHHAIDRHGVALTAAQLTDELRAGAVPEDAAFDRLLPMRLRVVSRRFWTPLAACVRGARWLAELGVTSVVDIGAGAGKFCVVAALTSSGRFTGLEHRPRLVAVANRLARQLEVDDRVRFLLGALGTCALPPAQAYYLYNPFGENRFGPESHLDDAVELGEQRFARDVALVEQLLSDAAPGTYALTYTGFGGCVPDGYASIRVDRTLPNVLQLWQKAPG